MDYMTVKEAGEKWGLGARIVTLYCAEGRLDGAVKKGNVWLIPQNASIPTDRRRKKIFIQEEIEPVKSKETAALHEQRQPMDVKSIQSFYENKELFIEIMKHFPYPMHICEADGTMIYANEAFLKFVKVSNPEKIFRKHNVFKDPNLERWGVKEFVMRAYQGETVHAYDVKVPVQELIGKFSGNKEVVFESLFHNMTAFPIYNSNNQLLYVVTVFVTSRYYHDKEEIMKGKEYIEDHWREDFDIDRMTSTVNLSRYYYMRLFKKHTGMTPYQYYQDVKVGKLRERMCDKNLSIAQVFTECGVDYNGNYVKIFKQKIGMTPSQYRAMITKK
jgi:AraC-like DNA-binding protein